jgi:predicted small metal-binding protein
VYGEIEMKMKMVKCSDVVISNCDYMALGNNLDDVERNMLSHIESEHKELLENMTGDEAHLLKHRVSTFLGRSCGCGRIQVL